MAWSSRHLLRLSHSLLSNRIVCKLTVTTLEEAEHLLETYSFEYLLDLNDLTEADALLFLLEEGFIEPPEIKPLDFE